MDIACVRCGNYQISAIGVSELQKITLEQRANLSGWIRENQGCRILGNDLPSLKKLRTPTVGEKANKILLHMAKSSARPGARFSIASTIGTEVFDEGFSIHLSSIELTSVAWATNDQEVFYLLQDYLCTETGYIKSDHGFVITPKGWAYLDSLNRTNTNSTVAFIAMWLTSKLTERIWQLKQESEALDMNRFELTAKNTTTRLTMKSWLAFGAANFSLRILPVIAEEFILRRVWQPALVCQ
jgi:hypothetical protein